MMAKGPIDRRAYRTRSALQQALYRLVQDKDYEAITVQDICLAADIGRSTFYEHFTGKDDLKRSGLEHLRHALVNQKPSERAGLNQPFGFSLILFEHALEHRDHYRSLAGGPGGTIVLAAIRDLLQGLVLAELRTDVGATVLEGVPREVVVQYTVSAYTGLLTWWLDGDTTLSPTEMDEAFRRLITQGVGSGARRPNAHSSASRPP